MKILVTGGAGFIGSAVVRHIINNTQYQVCNVDKLTYAGNLNSLGDCSLSDRYSFLEADICDQSNIKKIIRDYKPNYIMHLAAESHVDRSIDGPDEFIQTNVVGTYKLLTEALGYYKSLENGIKDSFRFLHISTDEVYGDLANTNELFTENTSYAPSSPYSASKAASDHFVRAWGRTFGLPVLITNCSNNYGPYHFPEKLIPHMILNALSGKPLPIYGDGSQIRDWLFVEDHVNALFKVLNQGSIGETYNIGGNNEMTNLSVVELICELLEGLVKAKPKNINKYKDLITYVKDRPGHDARYAVDSTKIQSKLGWRPVETFETGLKKTVEWYLNNSAWWKCVLSGEYKLNRLGDQHGK